MADSDPLNFYTQRSTPQGGLAESLYSTWGPKGQIPVERAYAPYLPTQSTKYVPTPDEINRIEAETIARIDAASALLEDSRARGVPRTPDQAWAQASSSGPALPSVAGALAVAGSVAAVKAVEVALTADQEEQRRAQAVAVLEAASYNTIVEGSFNDPGAQTVYTLRFFEDWKAKSEENRGVRVDLPYVNRVSMSAPNAVVRTRGMDGTVYAEHAAIAQRTFVIEGRSGTYSAPSTDPEAGLDIRRFTNLRNLIETYASTSARNKSALVRFKDSRLVLDFSFEDESYFCDVMDFSYRRNAESSTFSFEYTLTLVTNGPLGRQANPVSLTAWKDPADAPGPTGSATRQGKDELETDRETFAADKYKAYIATIERLNSFFRKPEKPFAKVDALASFTCSELYDLRVGITVLNGALDSALPASTMSEGSRARIKGWLAHNAYILDLMHSLKGGSNTGCPAPPWSFTAYSILPAAALVAAFIRLLNPSHVPSARTGEVYLPYRPGLLAGLPVNPNQGPEQDFVVPQGMRNANDIAAYWYGDYNYAWRIIDANRMRDAYTFGDGTPLEPGVTIKLPSPDKPAVRNNDLMGTDLLIENGDLVLVGSNDIKRVSGYPCYSQNLMHRMQTFRGHNKVFPNYGLPDDVLSSADSTIPATIRTQVKDQIRQDHRTDKVERTTLTELGDKVQVDVLVKPIAGPKGHLQFYYNLASGVTP